MGKGRLRRGLLRSNSSYGPPLDKAQTINDADPSVNAAVNSLFQPVIVLARSRSASASVAHFTTRPSHRAQRRVSFSKGSAIPLSPEASPHDVAAASPPVAAESGAVPGASHNPPRHNSDPGPMTLKGSWFRTVLSGAKKPGAPHPDQPPDMIDTAISHIARLMLNEGDGKKALAKAKAKIHELMDVELYRQELRECLERHEASQHTFDLDPHVYQIPLVDLYESVSTEINCGDHSVYIPHYMVATAEQIARRSKSQRMKLRPDELRFDIVKNAKQQYKHNYHNLISLLDLKTTQLKEISHRCTTHQISQVLHHFLRGLHEPPLDPAFFHIVHELCFRPCRDRVDGEDSKHLSSAEIRATKNELSEQEKKCISIGRIILCAMPQAHADALEYLIMFLMSISTSIQDTRTSLPGGPPTCSDTSLAFGYAICGPRDTVKWLASIGVVPSANSGSVSEETMGNAQRMVEMMSCQILYWMMCYWFDLRHYRDDRKLLELAEPRRLRSMGLSRENKDEVQNGVHATVKRGAVKHKLNDGSKERKKESTLSKGLAALEMRTRSSRDRKKKGCS